MKVVLSIIAVILILAAIFFIFNYKKLDTIYLDNGIGSFSAVKLPIYDTSDINNPNVYHGYISADAYYYVIPSNLTIYVSSASLTRDSDSNNYPNLKQFIEDLNDGSLVSSSVVSDDTDYVMILKHNDFYLTDGLSRLTPEQFNITFPQGKEETIKFTVYKVLMGDLDSAEAYASYDISIKCFINIARNPLGSNEDFRYILTVVPYEFYYEYNFFDIVSNVSNDIELIKAAKPEFNNFIVSDYSEGILGYVERFFKIFLYPIRLFRYYSASAEILVGDISGLIFVNELDAYSPF